MGNLNIALDDNFSLLNLLIATVPLLATLAGFLISLGEAAYYRIMTECGAPSLQSFALRFVVAGFVSVLVVAASFQFSIASQVLVAMVALCFAGALLAIFSLRREIALPELLVITAAASVLLAECVSLATGSQPLSEFVPSGEKTPVVQVSLLWLVAYLATACGLFFEAGFFSARLRKIYLVDENESWIVLTACAGGKAFLRSIVRVKNGACFTGDLVRFAPMEELPSYRWQKFKRVTIRPMVDAVDFGSDVAVFHNGGKRFIRKSGVGVAGALQRKALLRAGCAEVRLATEHGDLLHINTAGLGGALRMIECHWRGIPVVVTAHNIAELLPGTFRFLQSRVAVRAYHRWLEWFYCSADVMIVPSPYAHKMLIDGYGVKGFVKVISNGVDVEAFRNVEQGDVDRALSLLNDSRGMKNKVDLSKHIILSAGMQVDRKGVAEFVDLAERMPHFEFVWVGETMPFAQPARARRAIAKAKLLDNVHFVGYVDHGWLPAFFSLASAFLFLSSEETEGLVVLEALASRTPLVVGDIPVYREWLQDGVNCFKVDIAALRSEDSKVRVGALLDTGDAIERACAQQNGDMVERGYAIACERDLRKVGESLKRVYGDVSF